ncbi:unnamed protein product [Thlaspi arvense]|uniref:Uncharacterized protein n=1 Tax=Thlaspi arvense TaxID=13288 RepID=A0AAU9SLS8_THLAR|nr:unnamed protein product [Thlaspi arvense]
MAESDRVIACTQPSASMFSRCEKLVEEMKFKLGDEVWYTIPFNHTTLCEGSHIVPIVEMIEDPLLPSICSNIL